MTEADAIEAITQAWHSGWSALQPLVPVAYDNESFTAATAWVRVTVRHTTRVQITQGKKPDRKFEARGYIFVQLFAPVDGGANPIAKLADDARKVLEGEPIVSGGDAINVYAGQTGDESVDGAWNMKALTFPIRYVETR